jgi:hypothetical protein
MGPRTIFIAGMFAVLGGAAAQAESDAWLFVKHKDPLTGAIAVTFGDGGARVSFDCEAGGDAGVFAQSSKTDFAIGENRQVTWRIDHGTLQTAAWNNGVDSAGAFVEGNDAVSLARQIADATDQLVVDTGNGPIVFSVKDASAAIVAALQICRLQ